MKESRMRSIVKGVTWRIVASGTTMGIVFLVTGNLELVASVGVVDITAKVLFYYLHERAWGQVHWGQLGVEPNFLQKE
ncbi:MAG: DUF2061 domain-containing protein [Patescibacteria group bacterium]